MDALSDDCWGFILQLLDADALASCCRVCRRMRELSSRDSLWRSLFAARFVGSPLAAPPTASYRSLFSDCELGRGSVACQVISRHAGPYRYDGGHMLSAVNAAATWDRARGLFLVQYTPRVPGQPTGPQMPEYVVRDKLRAVPGDIEGLDATAVVFQEGAYESGQEVEIQYRFNPQDEFQWWRGFVHEVSRPDGKRRYIRVCFPQYDEGSVWWSVIVVEGSENNSVGDGVSELASVGGIRKVRPEESARWAFWFQRAKKTGFELSVAEDGPEPAWDEAETAEQKKAEPDGGSQVA
eukprot:m51a1_g2639 hypothetical protein (295) ;mRNA; f:588876-589912